MKNQKLMLKLGYQFQQIELLKQALTHRSVSQRSNYERLEFLGDSLLGVIIAKYLYCTFPKEKEGYLTRMRATLVRQEALAKIAKDLKLGDHLILSVGELKSGGHHRESILADVVEAIIGAIYLDSGSFDVLEAVVLKWYTLYVKDIAPSEQLKDPKSRLQELLQGKKMPLPLYDVLSIQGDAPHQHFTISCKVEGLDVIQGEGASRRFAEQSAAAEILKLLEKN